MKNNKGITLIALVITIIVLLILAGISIATLTGENGVLSKANVAEEENKKAEYKEVLQLIENGLIPDKVINQWSGEKYLDEVEKEIPKNETFKEAKIKRVNAGTIMVTTKEKWVYLIKENEVKYVGLESEVIAPDLQQNDITFTPSKKEWTCDDITVEISTKITGFILEYSLDGETWNRYTSAIPIDRNLTIQARLNSEADFPGTSATKKIEWIDKVAPSGKISTEEQETSIAVSVANLSDVSTDVRYGNSGIKKIVYSINDGKTEPYETTNLTETSHSFTGLTGGTTYTITVAIYDVAGNVNRLNVEATTILTTWLVRNDTIINKSFTMAGSQYANFGRRISNL